MANPDYFTIAEFRANVPDMTDDETYTDAKIEAAAAFFTAIVEREIDEPLIPRSYSVTLDGNGSDAVRLPHPYLTSITSIFVDSVSVNPSLISFGNGALRYTDSTVWSRGIGNVTVTYVAGKYDECPADVKDAVMWAVRDRLMSQNSDSAQDPRQTSMTNDLGGTNQFVLPGEKRPTGYPELDAVIASYRRNPPFYGSL